MSSLATLTLLLSCQLAIWPARERARMHTQQRRPLPRSPGLPRSMPTLALTTWCQQAWPSSGAWRSPSPCFIVPCLFVCCAATLSLLCSTPPVVTALLYHQSAQASEVFYVAALDWTGQRGPSREMAMSVCWIASPPTQPAALAPRKAFGAFSAGRLAASPRRRPQALVSAAASSGPAYNKYR